MNKRYSVLLFFLAQSLCALDRPDETSSHLAFGQFAPPVEVKEAAQTPPISQKTSEAKDGLVNYAYLGDYLKPWEAVPSDELIEINFENAELKTVTDYFEAKYKVKFIPDTVIQPMPAGGKSLEGIKVSFTTNHALTPKQAWDLFVGFINMAGLTIIPGPGKREYRITTNDPRSPLSANKSPLPVFIGVDPQLMPNNDTKVRYVYFVKNASLATLGMVVSKMLSATAAPLIQFEDVNALIMTDRSDNIRSILEILKELDSTGTPETLIIMRLKKTESTKIKEIYDSLAKENRSLLQRINSSGKKASGPSFFTDDVRIFAEARTNSLIILGPKKSAAELETFIRDNLDKEIDLPYSPLHVYPLKFVGAKEIAGILNELKNYQPTSPAGQVGGLIGETRLLKPSVSIAAESATNSLIINADYDDYLQIRDLLQKVDVEQPQVAIRILVLDLNINSEKDFGIQMRNMIPGLSGVLGKNVNFQTSGLPFGNGTYSQIVQKFTDAQGNVVGGAQRLLGDLVTIAGQNVPGSTLLTLGQDINGVWGLFKILQSITQTSVIAKPFLITTNKYRSHISIGTTLRVTTSTIVGGADTQQTTVGDLTAALDIDVTPQISPDGLVTLNVTVDQSQFLDNTGTNRTQKKVATSVILADNQVLALGGITKDIDVETITKVPVLGDVPLLGWFFKNKVKQKQKVSLLVLISANIVKAHDDVFLRKFTQREYARVENQMCTMMNDSQLKDPVERLFFHENKDEIKGKVRDFAQADASFAQRLEERFKEEVAELAQAGKREEDGKPAEPLATQPQEEKNTPRRRLRGSRKKNLSDYAQVKQEGAS